eukprot:SAG31_NODE_32852_length_351_cov_0.575397_1_plen_116_part_11
MAYGALSPQPRHNAGWLPRRVTLVAVAAAAAMAAVLALAAVNGGVPAQKAASQVQLSQAFKADSRSQHLSKQRRDAEHWARLTGAPMPRQPTEASESREHRDAWHYRCAALPWTAI